VVVDPEVIAKQIKLKYPAMAIIIDYLAVFNAFLAILAFAMQQVKIYGMRPVEKKKKSSGETWTKGTLASFIPYFPEPAQFKKDNSMLYFVLSPIFNKDQMKNSLTIICTVAGLFETTISAPIIMAYMTLTEIGVMKKIMRIIYGRLKMIAAVFTLVGMLSYYVAYAIFLQHQCDDMLWCFRSQMLRIA